MNLPSRAIKFPIHRRSVPVSSVISETEIEFKYRVDEDGYDRFLRIAKSLGIWRKEQKFKNHYFETPHFDLSKEKIRMRIRQFSQEQYFLTVKSPAPVVCHSRIRPKIRQEQTTRLSADVAECLVAGTPGSIRWPSSVLRSPIPTEYLNDLICFGKSKVKRQLCDFGQFMVELDKVKMFGRNFYEIEVEVPDHCQLETVDTQVRQFLSANKIFFRASELSKTARFFRLYRSKTQFC